MSWISVEDKMPESGAHVLASCRTNYGGFYVCVAYHVDRWSYPIDVWRDWIDEVETEYNEETDQYYLCEGWFEVIKNWDDYDSVAIEDKVTHWTDLPEPCKEDVR